MVKIFAASLVLRRAGERGSAASGGGHVCGACVPPAAPFHGRPLTASKFAKPPYRRSASRSDRSANTRAASFIIARPKARPNLTAARRISFRLERAASPPLRRRRRRALPARLHAAPPSRCDISLTPVGRAHRGAFARAALLFLLISEKGYQRGRRGSGRRRHHLLRLAAASALLVARARRRREPRVHGRRARRRRRRTRLQVRQRAPLPRTRGWFI